MTSMIKFLSLFSLATLALGAVIEKRSIESTIAALQGGGMNVVDAVWTGAVKGAPVTLSGTVQQAVSQLQNMYPGENINSSSTSKRDLELLAARDPTYTICNIQWDMGPAMNVVLEEGIAYLNSLGDGFTVSLGPGPNTCSRVSCSYDSGIWFCNDADYTVHVLATELAKYTQMIIAQCTNWSSGRVLGVQDDSVPWFVVAGGAGC